MFPWFWTWAPQLHLPLSGDVAQRIDPSAWFAAIPPEAGNGHIEQQACAVASYGKQLGLITELLLDVTQQTAPTSAQGQQALRQLQAIRDEIPAPEAWLSWERVLLDVHSGRLFGRLGVLWVDLVGVLLGGLAMSGIAMWWLHRRRL